MQLTEDEQGVESFGAKSQIPGNGLHKPGTFGAALRPGEKELAALVANDLGDPAALNELVHEGWAIYSGVSGKWSGVRMKSCCAMLVSPVSGNGSPSQRQSTQQLAAHLLLGWLIIYAKMAPTG